MSHDLSKTMEHLQTKISGDRLKVAELLQNDDSKTFGEIDERLAEWKASVVAYECLEDLQARLSRPKAIEPRMPVIQRPETRENLEPIGFVKTAS